jgi:hypothetical protein
MTDDDYAELLNALAAKQLKWYRVDPLYVVDIRHELERVTGCAHILKAVARRLGDEALLAKLAAELERSPLEIASLLMEEAGILDALDEAPNLIFRECRCSAVPAENIEFLRRAGFSDAEINILLFLVAENAEKLVWGDTDPSQILEEARRTLPASVSILLPQAPGPVSERKKRKILNGIGNLLGGSVAGIGNVLLATGTFLAPNPATGATAIASGALAVSSIFAGLGDLRGE